MTYQWKIPGIIPVEAQKAGEELDRIYTKHGKLEPSDIVEESRNENAPLHPCFEWDNQKAADKYRESQAMMIVRSIVTVQESPKGTQQVRAFVHTEQSYKPISVVVNSEKQMAALLETALSELRAFKRKYETLKELSPVFDAIEEVSA